MSINATLFGQMITFAIFVWFTMKFIWPGLQDALEAREKTIADGLAAAEQGKQGLLNSQQVARQELEKARKKGESIIVKAQHQASVLLEEAKATAISEKNQIIEAGHKHLEYETNLAKQHLQQDVTRLAIKIAEKILERELKDIDTDNLLKSAINE